MATPVDHIKEWFGRALSVPKGNLTECFYFDRKEHIFFSILFVDYFMLDENLEIDPFASVSYSTDYQHSIHSWLQRMDKKDPTILSIPTIGPLDEKAAIDEATKFLDQHKIDPFLARIWDGGNADIEVPLK